MTTKSIWLSRTFLLAAAQAIAGAIVIFQGAYPALGWLALAKSVMDVILRLLTTQPATVTLPGR